MRKIIPFLLFLAAITISCSREPSVLNIKIDDKTESTYYRVMLKGEDEKFENLIYKDTIAYHGLRCGIYTLEVVSYGDYDLSSYAVKTVRVDEGINNETITLEKEDREDLPFFVTVKTSSLLSGSSVTVEIDGVSKSGIINKEGEVLLLFSIIEETENAVLKCTITKGEATVVEEKVLINVEKGGSYELSLPYHSGNESGDITIELEDSSGNPEKIQIEVLDINKIENTITLTYRAENGYENAIAIWYVNGIKEAEGKIITIDIDKKIKRVDLVCNDGKKGSVNSASMVFSSN